MFYKWGSYCFDTADYGEEAELYAKLLEDGTNLTKSEIAVRLISRFKYKGNFKNGIGFEYEFIETSEVNKHCDSYIEDWFPRDCFISNEEDEEEVKEYELKIQHFKEFLKTGEYEREFPDYDFAYVDEKEYLVISS